MKNVNAAALLNVERLIYLNEAAAVIGHRTSNQ